MSPQKSDVMSGSLIGQTQGTRPGVAFAEGAGEAFERGGEIRVRERVRQPGRRAEVREVEHHADAEFFKEGKPPVEPAPVVFARLAFDLVPGQGVAQPAAAEVLADELEILPPEAVVLGPFVLVDAQCGMNEHSMPVAQRKSESDMKDEG